MNQILVVSVQNYRKISVEVANIRERLFSAASDEEFGRLALEVFNLQYEKNAVYRRWCGLLGRKPERVLVLNDIPFLPIGFFKSHRVVSFEQEPLDYFKSSGTTQSISSRHYIRDFKLYERSFVSSFEHFFGRAEDFCYLALLPNYVSQGHSSLVYMMQGLIRLSRYSQSGFYPYDVELVRRLLLDNEASGIPTVLFGVTYALLDLAQSHRFDLKHTIVFETGGMKGRRAELPKAEVHRILREAFSVDFIASEYGMCELFSQAYSKSAGVFFTPPQMRVRITETTDPFAECKTGRSGLINVIDLANIDSCSFIQTEDIGRMRIGGGFEVLGRLDNSAIRGCNLMYEI